MGCGLIFLKQMRQQSHDSGEAQTIPITVRQLEAIIRISESLARMQLYVNTRSVVFCDILVLVHLHNGSS